MYKVPKDYVEQDLGYFNSDLFTKVVKEQVEDKFDKVNDLLDKANGLFDKANKNKDKDKIEEAPVAPTEENPDANQ